MEIEPSETEQGNDDAPFDMAELEADVIEVAQALQSRYPGAGPTPKQEKEFMREWLLAKGRTKEEVDAILEG